MHVFTRTCGIAPGHAGEALARAIALAREATETTGLAVAPWINVYGAPPDTIMFAACVESPAAVGQALAALHVGRAANDAIGEILAGASLGGPPALFAAVATVQCGPGKVADASAWAVDSANTIAHLTGLRTVVIRERSGPWATLRRVTLADSLSELDDAQNRCATDSCLRSSPSQQLLVRRLR